MPAYSRKTRSAVARCRHCTWSHLFFAVDRTELALRILAEEILHAAIAHKVNR
jgi:hypothetical protein